MVFIHVKPILVKAQILSLPHSFTFPALRAKPVTAKIPLLRHAVILHFGCFSPPYAGLSRLLTFSTSGVDCC